MKLEAGTRLETKPGIFPRDLDVVLYGTVVRTGYCGSPFCDGDCVVIDQDACPELTIGAYRHAIVSSAWTREGWHVVHE